jgi:acyl-[acyl-carrier-protein]-phospholipid O-acyltransferase/long-chain-fatty-acid--[acyl-carrier-protein] ligase
MLRLLAKLILRALFRVRVQGAWPKPRPERLVVVANHQSLTDAALLYAFLPWDVVWVVHTDIWRRWRFRIFIRWFPHVIVDPLRPQALRLIVQEVERGRPVAIFPEGRITVTGGLMKVYDAAAFLALHTGAALLAVWIDGAIYTIFSRMTPPFPRKLFPRIRLTVLEPRRLEVPEAPTRRARRRLAGRQLRSLLEEAALQSRPSTTLFAALADAAALYGRRARVLDDTLEEGRRYGWLLKASLALGRLIARESRELECVGVLLPNIAATVALVFGIFAVRRVAALLNYTAGIEGIGAAVRAARIRTVVTSRAFLERVRLAEKLGALDGIRLLYLEDLRDRFGFLDRLWLLGWALWFPKRALGRAQPGDPAVVLFTSGSESKPKGVLLSHDAILANVAQLRAVLDVANRYKFLTALPLFHSFGLTAGVIVPLLHGCRLFLYPSPLHYRTIPEIAYGRDCNVLLGTPSFLARYGELAHPYDFYKMQYVIAGAERLDEAVRRLWQEKFGIRILEGYGATECAPVVSVNTPFACKAGSVGRPLPGIECRITAAPGITGGGELHVRGPNLMLGYLREERPGQLEPPASPLGPGWYATGDVAEMDSEGYLYIRGRLRRFAKIAGEMVSLELAERIAQEASPQARSAAVARAEPGRGEIIVLFTNDPRLRREDLLAAAHRLGAPELAVARRIAYLEDLPRLASGKNDYVRLKALAEELG